MGIAYLATIGLSLAGMLVVLVFLTLFRILDTTPKSSRPSLAVILIDGYAMLVVALILTIIYVLLRRSGNILEKEQQALVLLLLSTYILIGKGITIFRMFRWFSRMIVRIRLKNSPAGIPGRELNVMGGKLQIEEDLTEAEALDGERDAE